MTVRENYKESGYIGQLFGVDIHYPIIRKEVRELVETERKLAWKTSEEQNISIYQVNNDFQDIENQFLLGLEEADQIIFLNMKVEELNARTNALNDETARINQETLENEIDEANANAFWGWVIGVVLFFIIIFIIKGH